MEDRLQFKEDHQCKPFSWFLENIYPEKFILDDPEQVFAYGRLKNPHSETCLDNLQNDDKERLAAPDVNIISKQMLVVCLH